MKKLHRLYLIIVFVLVSFSAMGLWAQNGEQPYTWWTKTYGGQADDESREAHHISDGGYIFVGSTNSFGAGGYDIYLIKTDASGNTVWMQTYGGTGDDMGHSVQQTSDGGYIVAGWTDSFGSGGRDVYLIKTDASGTSIWTKTFGGVYNDIATSVKQTSDGGYILAGQTEWAIAWDDIYLIKTDATGTATWTQIWDISFNSDRIDEVQQTTDGGYILAGHSYYTGSGNILDFTMIKTDPNGNRLWTKTYGILTDQRAFSVQQTSDGGYILSGYTADYTAIPQILPDVWLVKTDVNGVKIWDKTFGGPNEEFGWSVRQTDDGGYIIAGHTNSFGAGGDDAFMIRTDELGNDLWTTTYGGTGDDEGYSVEQTSPGKYILSGYTYSYGAGGKDAWLIRVVEALEVTIDIKPGSDPNSINPRSKGVIPVAILTDASFDATTVDPLSVQFGPDGATESHGKGHIEDADGDGDLDMVLHFKTQQTGIQCGDTDATLTGTANELNIIGTDAIRTVGCGSKKEVAEGETEISSPEGYTLYQNYPNPFNPETEIRFILKEADHVSIIIYNIRGEEIRRLVDSPYASGEQKILWDGEDDNGNPVSSGVYLYRFKVGSFTEMKKMTLIR